MNVFSGFTLLASVEAGGVLLLGLAMGSFYTALASRILRFCYGPDRKSPHRWRRILLERSHCFACHAPLRFMELIPVLSYALQRGRCRRCATPIGKTALFGEGIGGMLALSLRASGASWAEIAFALALSGHLYIAIATDWQWLRLDPENTMFVLLFAAALCLEQNGFKSRIWIERLCVAGGVLALFGLLSMVTRWRGLGVGDALLGACLALAVGLPWILIAVQLAACAAIVYVAVVARDLRAPAPLGAFLSATTILLLPAPMIWRQLGG